MIEVYTDGASKGNPGPAGAGIFFKKASNIERISVPLGIMTNHEAEFHACIIALKRVVDQGETIVSIRSDSKLLVDAIEKNYVKHPVYKILLEEIVELIDAFDYCFFKWIPSKENKEADQLARKAIRENS